MTSRRLLKLAGIALLIATPMFGSDDTARFARQYADGAHLTAQQEQAVITLVGHFGVTNVARIYTYHHHLSSDRGIGVEEKEVHEGSHVHCRILQVSYRPWLLKTARGKPILERGDYSITQAIEKSYSILQVGQDHYRVRLEGGIVMHDAQQHLAKFINCHYVFAPDVEPIDCSSIDPRSTELIARQSKSDYTLSCSGSGKYNDTSFTFVYRTLGTNLFIKKVILLTP